MIQQTSLAAFFEVKPKLNEKQKIVLDALEEIAPANNRQIAEHLKWPINTVTPRVLELRQKHQVVLAYVNKDVNGRTAIFWKPKDMPFFGAE